MIPEQMRTSYQFRFPSLSKKHFPLNINRLVLVVHLLEKGIAPEIQ